MLRRCENRPDLWLAIAEEHPPFHEPGAALNGELRIARRANVTSGAEQAIRADRTMRQFPRPYEWIRINPFITTSIASNRCLPTRQVYRVHFRE